jgi:hypothetical protein
VFIEKLLCGNLPVQGEEEQRLLRQQQQVCLVSLETIGYNLSYETHRKKGFSPWKPRRFNGRGGNAFQALADFYM